MTMIMMIMMLMMMMMMMMMMMIMIMIILRSVGDISNWGGVSGSEVGEMRTICHEQNLALDLSSHQVSHLSTSRPKSPIIFQI